MNKKIFTNGGIEVQKIKMLSTIKGLINKALKRDKKIVFTTGRFTPLHRGHINFILWLLSEFDEIIIGIGSCYESGLPKHPLLAFIREKMIKKSLAYAGIDVSRVRFVHLQDFGEWDLWWQHIINAPGVRQATHFVTGNVEDILSVIDGRDDLDFPFQGIINPETDTPKKFFVDVHATDLRNAIKIGDWEFFKRYAAFGSIELMGPHQAIYLIQHALDNNAIRIVPGRQAVDAVITCESEFEGKMMLCGYRSKEKANFPGYLGLPGGGVEDYCNPFFEAIREVKEETGLLIEVLEELVEPTVVRVNGVLANMTFVGLFSSEDPTVAGNEGGSSQVWHIHLACSPNKLRPYLQSNSDLNEVDFRPVTKDNLNKLAYQQPEMVRKALGRE